MKTEIGIIMVFATLCFLDVHVVTPAVSRAALEDDNWRAAINETEEGYNEGLSADQILNTDFEPEFADDNRTIDEINAAAGTGEGAALVAAENGEVNIDMDMILDPIQYESPVASSNDLRPKNRLAGTGVDTSFWRWPKGIIPYIIAPNDYTANERKIIFTGMQMWMNITCIRFEPVGSAEANSTGHDNHIYIQSGAGCFSHVGRKPRLSSQKLILKAPSCIKPAKVAHELGHAIGLDHEHTRQDRDDYVQVSENNIKKYKSAFEVNKKNFSTFGTPYDYCSVMGYGPTDFSYGTTGKELTIIPKDLGYISVIGRDRDLTYTDATIVNKMYGCGITAPQTSCPARPCTDSPDISAAACEELELQHPGPHPLAPASNVTSKGVNCKQGFPCGKHGKSYYWCWTETNWDYCCAPGKTCGKQGHSYNWCWADYILLKWSKCEPESESTNPQTVKVQVTGSMPVEVGCFKNFCWRRSHQSQEWLSRFQGAWWAYVQSAAGYYVDCENALECKQYGAAEMKIKGPWKRDFQQPQPSALPRFGDKKLNREK